MPLAIAYWVLMLLWLVFGIIYIYPNHTLVVGGQALILFLLMLILGWRVFGQPIQR